ncbi:thiamine pyrophosphate-dependent enzyme [Methanomicrobium antiquum]|uniref:Thiamine pyrophosphate-dependent enzyme n=1 Tax=Methanomicrobium antiquum TaxID=487686 RepID=A0AAF0FR32_9EURY|nr:thiamine pyrophosphate-dependent enzyme [Methanomicrobium antiquum]WFN37022.1 thiamine pyrophosphate-dependent enzyme [Methanomicrobium antiquum]
MKGEMILAEAVIKGSDTCYGVPGYPVTELCRYSRAEYTVNEKTALEYALGDSLSGLRSVVIVKNAGMNALCDPLVNATTQGLLGGVVIIAGDDTEVVASQNRQDSRYFAEISESPLIEPDESNLSSAVESAMQASERFSRVCIIHVASKILEACIEDEHFPFRKNGIGNLTPPNLTMKGRCEYADNLTNEMYEWSKPPFIWPPCKDLVKLNSPCKTTEQDYSGRDFLSEHQTACPPKITKDPETCEKRKFSRTLCKECPFKTLFEIITDSGEMAVIDTGCSLLAKNPPYGFGLANYGLGSSPAVAAKSTKIALIGDYAVLHSAINALFDIYDKEISLLCIVINNKKMAMTGGQSIPDITRWLKPFCPLVTDANDPALKNIVSCAIEEKKDCFKIIVVNGICPKGCEHEKIKC